MSERTPQDVLREAVEGLEPVALTHPHGPQHIEHDESCAFAYGNLTYPCRCFVRQSAVLALLADKAIAEAPDSPPDSELRAALSGAAHDLVEQRQEGWSLVLHAEQVHGCTHTAQIRETFAIPPQQVLTASQTGSGAASDTLSEKPGLDVTEGCVCCNEGFYCRHRCPVHPKPNPGTTDSGKPWSGSTDSEGR